jgi:hypothetical protein
LRWEKREPSFASPRAFEIVAKAFTFIGLDRSTDGDEFPAFFTIVIQERRACRFVHVGIRATAVENDQVFVSWIHRGVKW